MPLIRGLVINVQSVDANGDVVTDPFGDPATNEVNHNMSDWRGNYPTTWWLTSVNDAGAADDDVLYTSDDVSMYNYHAIQNNDTVNIDVHVSLDGTTFVGPHAIQTSATTAPGTTLVTVIAAGTVGVLHGKFNNIRVDQAAAGTVEAGNVLIAHGVV